MAEDTLFEDGVSLFRPSYSPTWANCLGSLLPSLKMPDYGGIDAARGTVFHELMAEWQLNGRPDYRLGEIARITNERGDVFEIEIDEDMFVFGEECLAYVSPIPGDRFVETRVDISSLTPIPRQGGTCDLACCEFHILDITDWKYGIGVQVFAFKNTQCLCYAWGFFEEFDWIYDFRIIRMRIAQPRLGHWDVWEITREELIEWAAWLKERAYGAWKRNADRTPSPKACQWCKVQTDCAALEATRQSLADLSFDDLDKPITDKTMRELTVSEGIAIEPAAQLTTEQLCRIYNYRKLMERWFKDVGETLVARGVQGEELRGWKIVEGRSRRQYIDENEAADKLSLVGLSDDEIWVKKIISPNQLKPVLRGIGIRGKAQDEFVKTLVYKPPGKLTLAPDGDNRAEVSSVVDLFEVEDEDDD